MQPLSQVPLVPVRFATLRVALFLCAPIVFGQDTEEVDPTTRGPEKGALVIVGGGFVPQVIFDRFFELAGGKDAPLVVIPTAQAGEGFSADGRSIQMFRQQGATDVTMLHTRDREVADSDAFIEPLKKAKAIWFTGGRQWRLVDSYLGTKTEEAIHAVLERGGVVGGSSAGATIQGSYLVRGAREGNHIMMAPGYEEGFALLRNAAIDQHLLARQREKDLLPVIECFPKLLGVGIDEGTALVVQGTQAEVIGASKVYIYDIARKDALGDAFYLPLEPGTQFDLEERMVLEIKP